VLYVPDGADQVQLLEAAAGRDPEHHQGPQQELAQHEHPAGSGDAQPRRPQLLDADPRLGAPAQPSLHPIAHGSPHNFLRLQPNAVRPASSRQCRPRLVQRAVLRHAQNGRLCEYDDERGQPTVDLLQRNDLRER
jgi:hypothetical protein